MGYLIYGGRNSRDFGIEVSGGGTFSLPERDVETISVPGRSGDLQRDNGRWKNITVPFAASIPLDFPNRADAIRAWIGEKMDGYYRLEDSYHPDEYRLGCFLGPWEPSTGFLNRTAEFTLQFDCKPQRFLKSGEEAITLTSPGTIVNPGYGGSPLLKVSGTGGTLTLNGRQVIFSSIDQYTMLDCETMNAYKGSVNKNNTITSDPRPISLVNGDNAVSWTSGITSVEITPRWWKL